jgi:hypothetical protein
MTGPSGALELLQEQLKKALELFDAKPQEDDANPQRDGAMEALGAVNRYLREVGVEARLPLFALLGALDDASNGRKNPILTPAKFKGPRKLIHDAMQMITASAAITLFVQDDGWEFSTALKEAAKAAGVGCETLKTYRKNLTSGKAAKEATKHYWERISESRKRSRPGERGCRALVVVRAAKV